MDKMFPVQTTRARCRIFVLALLLFEALVSPSSTAAAVSAVPQTQPLFEKPAEKSTLSNLDFNLKPPTASEKAINFGLVFAAQVGTYIVTQNEIIREHGSFKNWIQYPLMPHFDKDNFDFNIIKHSFVGHYYYLFYRSRGYRERSAFFWAIGSSLLFEFGIETVTERPSFQDIYLTPVFGTILGMGMERVSRYFHSLNTTPTTLIGYLFNPMLLIPGAKCECSVVPNVGRKGEAGVVVTYRF